MIQIADKFVKALLYKMFKKIIGMIKRPLKDMVLKVKKVLYLQESHYHFCHVYSLSIQPVNLGKFIKTTNLLHKSE